MSRVYSRQCLHVFVNFIRIHFFVYIVVNGTYCVKLKRLVSLSAQRLLLYTRECALWEDWRERNTSLRRNPIENRAISGFSGQKSVSE